MFRFQVVRIIISATMLAGIHGLLAAETSDNSKTLLAGAEVELSVIPPVRGYSKFPFIVLSIVNKTKKSISIPKSWLDASLDNVVFEDKQGPVGSLSPFPPPVVDNSVALMVGPKANVDLILPFPMMTVFDARKAKGEFCVRWIHDRRAKALFIMNGRGGMIYPSGRE